MYIYIYVYTGLFGTMLVIWDFSEQGGWYGIYLSYVVTRVLRAHSNAFFLVCILGKIMGKPWENHRKTIGKWWFNGGLRVFYGIYPLGNNCLLWKIMILNGNSHYFYGHVQ